MNKITNIVNYFHKKEIQSNLRTKLPNYNAGNNFKKYNTKNNLNCHIIICGISESLKNLLIFLKDVKSTGSKKTKAVLVKRLAWELQLFK